MSAADLPALDGWALEGRTVLVRVDFNVPVIAGPNGPEVADDFRIRTALPLFAQLQAGGARVVAATHFGRPHGKVDARYDVGPIRQRLAELSPGVELLENLRFDPGEEANDPAFGASLVAGRDYYVNEAFGASHRAHASVMVPPTLVPSAAGPNLRREVGFLLDALTVPARPFVAIVGGAKVADKLGVVRALVERADTVIVGGAMAYTFEAALGRGIGSSLVDPGHLEDCRELLASGKVVIPLDTRGLAVGQDFGEDGGPDEPVDFGADIPDGFEGFDVGAGSLARFAEVLDGAQTVFWNGPLGFFEDPRFAVGTEAIARLVAGSPALSIVGGGDSAAALARFGLSDQIDFVSSGGGASLELLEFGDLPGLRALREGRRA